MITGFVTCPKCRAQLTGEALQQPEIQECPSCESNLEVSVFPALYRASQSSQAGETIMAEGEASCFYHPQKKAALPCEACGRFLCALCDVELDGQHLCPACIESGKRKGKIETLNNRRINHDSLALTLATVPLLVWPTTIITSPIAIFYIVRKWNAPGSIIKRNRWRFIVAMAFAALEIIVCPLLLYKMIVS